MYTYEGKNRRVAILDEMRGLVIILMILFHLGYDLVYIFGVDMPLFHTGFIQDIVQPFIACTFTLIAGAACRYSRNNARRGALVFGLACAMTAITRFFMPDQVIWFGVLHMLGVSMIIFSLTARLERRDMRAGLIPDFWSMMILLILFAATYNIPRGFIGFEPAKMIYLPQMLYRSVWLAPLGLPGPGFFSSDYFPIIPWIFLFFAGTRLGLIFRSGNMPDFMYRVHFPFLKSIGCRSLLIYLLHQPITYGILFIIFQVKALI